MKTGLFSLHEPFSFRKEPLFFTKEQTFGRIEHAMHARAMREAHSKESIRETYKSLRGREN